MVVLREHKVETPLHPLVNPVEMNLPNVKSQGQVMVVMMGMMRAMRVGIK